MDFGMPMLMELDGIAPCADLCAALALDFVELNMNLPCCADAERMDIPALRRMAQERGIYFTLHLDERMDVCDWNPLVRRAYLETVGAAVALAKGAGMPILNMHLSRGVYFTLPARRAYLYDENEALYQEHLRALRELADAAIGGSDITICIENTDGFLPFQRRGIEMLLESPHFGLTLDIGHMHGSGCADEDFFAAHIGSLRHMHLHDARGKSAHLPLDAGEVDWRDRLSLARAKGCRAVLEIKTADALRASVDILKRIGAIAPGR